MGIFTDPHPTLKLTGESLNKKWKIDRFKKLYLCSPKTCSWTVCVFSPSTDIPLNST